MLGRVAPTTLLTLPGIFLKGFSMKPSEYKPALNHMIWLISESPRGGSLYNFFYEGRATAKELAKILWSDIDPEVSIKIDDKTMTPIAWIANCLNEAIFSRKVPNLKKIGKDYIASDIIRIERNFDLTGDFVGKSLAATGRAAPLVGRKLSF